MSYSKATTHLDILNGIINKFHLKEFYDYSSYIEAFRDNVLKSYLENNNIQYFYNSISYFNDEGDLKSLNYTYVSNDNKFNSISKILDLIFDLINKKISYSFAYQLIHDKERNNIMFYFSNSKNNVIASNNEYINLTDILDNNNTYLNKVSNNSTFIDCLAYEDIGFDEIIHNKNLSELSRCLNISNSNYKNLKVILFYYRLIFELFPNNDDLFFYFIKPIIADKRFNGVLYIATPTILSSETINYLSLLLYRVLSEAVFKENEKLHNEVRDNAIKSAIAAIMARNMSHNIGSHVITNTKAQIERMAEKHNNIQSDLLGLSKLMHYIQERQDFISVLASGEHYSHGPVNLKSNIFDYIAYDGPSIRHNSTRMKNFFLDNIVRSEDFERRQWGINNIELKLMFEDKGKIHCLESLKSNDLESQELSKINLSIPYGINGRQAFLTIIENFIRNSAKHLKSDLKSTLLITIKVCKPDDAVRKNNFIITIYDNKQNFNDVISNINVSASNAEMLEKITPEKYAIRKNSLQIINSEGKIDPNHKGLKEMLICIAWLNGTTSYNIVEDDPSREFNVHFVNIEGSFGIEFELDRFEEFYEIICSNYRKTDATKGVLNIKLLEKKNELIEFIKSIPASEIYLLKADDNTEVDKNVLGYIKSVLQDYATRVNIVYPENEIELAFKKAGLVYSDSKDTAKNTAFYFNESLKNNLNISAFEKMLIVIDRGEYDLVTKTDEEKALWKNNFIEKLTKDDSDDETESSERKKEVKKFLEQHGTYEDNLIKDVVKLWKSYDPEKKSNSSPVSIDSISLKPGKSGYCLFKNHYEAGSNDKPFLEIHHPCEFLEGISGGNFTHSLIRNSTFTYKHFVKIIESCYTKIAIIDERLFDKYSDPPAVDSAVPNKNNNWGSESDYQALFMYIKNSRKESIDLEKLNSREAIKWLSENIIEYGNKIGISFEIKEGTNSLLSSSHNSYVLGIVKSSENINYSEKIFKQIINLLVKSSQQINTKRNWATYFEAKNIFIYNVKVDKNELWNRKFVSAKSKNNSSEVSIDQVMKNAHFISIHYAIIEKLCANHIQRNINREYNQEVPAIENSKNMTFSAEFMMLAEIFKEFRGKIAVHSGRGDLHKFGENKVAFLPLSSIEWAMENSKYMLTELFYNLKYFPINYSNDGGK